MRSNCLPHLGEGVDENTFRNGAAPTIANDVVTYATVPQAASVEVLVTSRTFVVIGIGRTGSSVQRGENAGRCDKVRRGAATATQEKEGTSACARPRERERERESEREAERALQGTAERISLESAW